jgi:hypothetical protein
MRSGIQRKTVAKRFVKELFHKDVSGEHSAANSRPSLRWRFSQPGKRPAEGRTQGAMRELVA